jgi:hypothetical protein
MDDTLPSKTELPDATVTDIAPTAPTVEREKLSAGEQSYLAALEDKNRYLTMLLGDKLIELEATKKDLLDHRDSLKQSYVSILKVHGVSEGKIDTANGFITVLSRTPKE